MNELKVKIKLTRNAEMPTYATEASAAVDLRAALEGGKVTIEPGMAVKIPTGTAISPERRDIVGILASRSGLSLKHGISLANGIGVIDADYRGEICAVLRNDSQEPYVISDGERIAQLMFVPIERASFIQTDELDDTERGTGGFGSTGKY